MNQSSFGRLSTGWLSLVAIVLTMETASFLCQPLSAADKPNADQAQEQSANIPPSIIAEAQRRGINLANVKLQGANWVVCEGSSQDSSCVVLGRASASSTPTSSTTSKLAGLSSTNVLDVHQYGQAVRHIALVDSGQYGRVTQTADQGWTFELHPHIEARVNVQGRPNLVVDSLPRYRREGTNLVRTKDLQLVRETLDARASEPFTVIVTVPALCEPCRRLDQLVQENLAFNHQRSTSAVENPNRLMTKVFILEYFSFAEAERELLGTGAVFPTTLVYGVETQPRQSISRLIGNLRGSSMEEISRPLAERFRRGSPHTMSRGVIAQELLFRPAALWSAAAKPPLLGR